jgi:hypothetical protein
MSGRIVCALCVAVLFSTAECLATNNDQPHDTFSLSNNGIEIKIPLSYVWKSDTQLVKHQPFVDLSVVLPSFATISTKYHEADRDKQIFIRISKSKNGDIAKNMIDIIGKFGDIKYSYLNDMSGRKIYKIDSDVFPHINGNYFFTLENNTPVFFFCAEAIFKGSKHCRLLFSYSGNIDISVTYNTMYFDESANIPAKIFELLELWSVK